MKRRFFVNGKVVMAAVGMAAAFSMWGCASGEGAAVQSIEETEERAETGDLEGERTGSGYDGNEGERKEEGAEDAGAEDVGAEMQDVDEAGRDIGLETEMESKRGKEERIKLDGMIQKVEDGSFVMEQLVSEVDEGTGLVMVGGNPENEGVVVDYTEDTVFMRRVTTDGMTGTDEAGTEQDLGENTIVHVTGMWRGDRFLAEEVSVFVDARK